MGFANMPIILVDKESVLMPQVIQLPTLDVILSMLELNVLLMVLNAFLYLPAFHIQ